MYSKIKVTLKDLLLYLLIVMCYHAYLSLYKKGKVTLCPALDLDIIDEHLVVGLFSVDAEPEPEKEEPKDDREFVHKGLAQRSFERVWTVTDDTKVGSVSFDDGLLVVELNKIVPDHHARKDYL